MAARYWVGGTATWNSTAGSKWATSSGGAGGAAVPTAADDVFFDVVSGAVPGTVVTLSLASPCRSINFTGYTGAFTHNSAVTLTIGDATAGTDNVALLLVSGMTYTLGNASSSALSFVSTSPTTQTITTGGKTLGNVTVNGAGSSYQLADANTASVVTLTAGGLSTNNQTCVWDTLSSANSNTRSLSLGSSNITLTGVNTVLLMNVVTGLTFNAGTSTITHTGINSSANVGAGLAFYNLANTGVGNPTYTCGAGTTVQNLTRTGTAVKTDGVSIGGNWTVLGTLTLTGSSAVNRLNVPSSVVGTQRTLTAAAVVLTNVDFQDIAGAGAAAPFTGTSLGDCQGNSGITFDAPATQVWGAAQLTGAYLRTTGVAGNYASVPDSAAVSITGDIDVRVKVELPDWSPAAALPLVAKFVVAGNQISFLLRVDSGSGVLRLILSANGSTQVSAASSVATGVTDGSVKWVRATWRASDGRCQYFLSDDGTSWTQLGTNVTISVASIFDSTSPVEVGTTDVGTGASYNPTVGKFHRVQLRNNILDDGTGIQLDANFATATANAASFVESSANAATVTINVSGGNWSTLTMWGEGRVPLPQDPVIVNRGTGTVTADMPRLGKDLTFTGFAGTWTTATTPGFVFFVFGSLTLATGMTTSGTQGITFAGRGSSTLTSAGKSFLGALTFTGPAGTYTLQDALAASGALTVNDGTFTTNNFAVTCATYAAESGRTTVVNLGTSTVTLTSTAATNVFTANSAVTTVNGASATVVISTASTSTRSVRLTQTGQALGTLSYTVANSPGALALVPVSGAGTSMTIGTLVAGSGREVTPFSGRMHLISVLNAQGAVNGYLYLPGVSGNYVSAPDSAALSVPGDLTIDVRAALDDWTPAAAQTLCAKEGGGSTRSYRFEVVTAGTLRFVVSQDGSTTDIVASTVVTGLADGSVKWLRLSWSPSGNVVKFYMSDDGATWTQLGADVATTKTAIFDGATALEIGSIFAGTTNLAVGKFYRVKVYSAYLQNGAGTPVFDADLTTKAVGANSFTEASANAATVTVNGTLAQVGDGRVLLDSSTAASQHYLRTNYTGSAGNVFTFNGTGLTFGTDHTVFPGTSGSYISAPDSAILDVSGDIDIRAKVALTDWTPATEAVLVAKWVTTGNQRSYELTVGTNGRPVLYTSADGSTQLAHTATAAVPAADGTDSWVRATMDVDDGAGNRVVKFYTSSNGVSWTQLGATVTTAGVTSLFNSTATLELGSSGGGSAVGFIGKLYEAQVRSGIDGTVVGEFRSNRGTQIGDYLTIRDSNAGGAAVWYAGSHSVNISNNTGWTFADFSTASSADTSTSANAESIAAGVTGPDTSTSANAESIAAGVTGPDTSTSANAESIAASFADADTSLAVEGAPPLVGLGDADTVGPVSDTGSATAAIVGPDVVTADEAATLGASLSGADTTAATEGAPAALVGLGDADATGPISDLGSPTAAVAGPDVITAEEAATAAAAASASDAASAQETAGITLPMAASDACSAAQEASSITAGLTAPEELATDDDTGTLAVLLAGSDALTADETGVLQALLAAGDLVGAADAQLPQVLIAASDVLGLAESLLSASLVATAADQAALDAVAALSAALAGAEALGGTEGGQAALSTAGTDLVALLDAVAAVVTAGLEVMAWQVVQRTGVSSPVQRIGAGEAIEVHVT